VVELLERRGLLDGMPVYLDEESIMPIPPLCAWGRYLSTAFLDENTMKEYGRAVLRADNHLVSLGAGVLSATEPDAVAYRNHRTRWQKKPVKMRT
jgi:hypothetical protein